jgi:hypothetical protein
MLEATKGQL